MDWVHGVVEKALTSIEAHHLDEYMPQFLASAGLVAGGLVAAGATKVISGLRPRGGYTPAQLADIGNQSTQIAPGIYRRSLYKEGLVTCIHGVRNYGSRNCLGRRSVRPDGSVGEFVFLTYNEVMDRVTDFAAGMVNIGLTKGDRVGFYSKNRIEWTIGAEACNSQSLPTVALYDTLGKESIQHIIQHSGMKTIISDAVGAVKVIDVKKHACPELKSIILMEDALIDRELMDKASAVGLQLYRFRDLEISGRDRPQPPTPPSPSDTAIIMYTSGTTGAPKGVVITHQNLVSAGAGVVLSIFPLGQTLESYADTDAFLSFLPLAHVLARTAESVLLYHGASIGYFQGDVTKLMEDVQALRPTLFVAVPRVFERIYSGIKQKLEKAPAVRRSLFKLAFNQAAKARMEGKTIPFWDRLVFSKFKSALGGRCRGMLSGSAPLRAEVQEFLSVCFQCPFAIGYGLTETCCAGFITIEYDPKCGRCGPPNPSCEIKLLDVPSLNYFTRDGAGEVLIRGPAVAKGYYKDPEKTAESFDEHGWFHTGDVARVNEDGTFSIIDRCKAIFKLSQGEYIAPEKVEAGLASSKLMAMQCIYGDSFRSFLVDVVVPEFPVLAAALAAQGITISAEDKQALCSHPKAKEIVLADLVKQGKANGLSGLETPKGVILSPELFSVENKLLTPTMKAVRAEVAKHFRTQIDQAYEEIEQQMAARS